MRGLSSQALHIHPCFPELFLMSLLRLSFLSRQSSLLFQLCRGVAQGLPPPSTKNHEGPSMTTADTLREVAIPEIARTHLENHSQIDAYRTNTNLPRLLVLCLEGDY